MLLQPGSNSKLDLADEAVEDVLDGSTCVARDVHMSSSTTGKFSVESFLTFCFFLVCLLPVRPKGSLLGMSAPASKARSEVRTRQLDCDKERALSYVTRARAMSHDKRTSRARGWERQSVPF